MITLAFAQMIYYFAISWPAYGGEDGLSLYLRNRLPRPQHHGPLDLLPGRLRAAAPRARPVADDRPLALRPRPRHGAAERAAADQRRRPPLRRPPDRLRDLGDDHRPRRRALRRPQPLRQPDDAVLAPLGRADRLRHPRRRRPALRPGRRRRALRPARAPARPAHRVLAVPARHPAAARRALRPRRRWSAWWPGGAAMPEAILADRGPDEVLRRAQGDQRRHRSTCAAARSTR